MMYEPVDLASSQRTTTRTITTTTTTTTSDESYTNYLTAFTDLSNYVTTSMEQVYSTLAYVDENRQSQNCSLFNDLIMMLRSERRLLLEYLKFIKRYRTVYAKTCLNFEKKATVPLMNRYNYIKISGYINTTEFICKNLIDTDKLIDYARLREISFMTRLCVNCRRSSFFDPSLCISDTTDLSDVELSDEQLGYLQALEPYMKSVTDDLPAIFRNFSRCSSRRANLPCTTILTETLDNLQVYIEFVRSYKNNFDLQIDFFGSLATNTPMDEFLETQLEGLNGRSFYLNIEANYLQTLFDDYTNILFRML